MRVPVTTISEAAVSGVADATGPEGVMVWE
jgi:hypothetical protein